MKRIFDVIVTVFLSGLVVPFVIAIAVAIKLNSRGNVFYCQQRVGLNSRLFTLYKFRTMHQELEQHNATITCDGDPRITGIGFFLRYWKFDEIPQFLNILKGDMSIVGPRPETADHVRSYSAAERKILSVRPGLTSRATLAFLNEEALALANAHDPEKLYSEQILPAKISLDMEYLVRKSFAEDAAILLMTFRKAFWDRILKHGRE